MEIKEELKQAAQSIAHETKARVETLDKSPLASKKFVFASVWNCVWLGLIGYGIHKELDANVLVALVYSAAAIQGLYLGGQSFVDAMVRMNFTRK